MNTTTPASGELPSSNLNPKQEEQGNAAAIITSQAASLLSTQQKARRAKEEVIVAAPARLCILGEHQDYFGLSVISCAMDLRMYLRGTPNNLHKFRLFLKDLNQTDEIAVGEEFPYRKPRDYLRSAIRILNRRGFPITRGYDVEITSEIPIAKGNSSSSALTVGWLKFLLVANGYAHLVPPAQLAELAFQAEVAEFHEPGGKQDHYAISLGGLLHLQFQDQVVVTTIARNLAGFLLVDSGRTKDTQGVLRRIKNDGFAALSKLSSLHGQPYCFKTISTSVPRSVGEAHPELQREMSVLTAILENRDLTREGLTLLQSSEFQPHELGRLLTEHHQQLRDGLGISTPQFETLINKAKQAGALGCKINGSGGGGCFLAYAPGVGDRVKQVLELEGALVYPVTPTHGATVLTA